MRREQVILTIKVIPYAQNVSHASSIKIPKSDLFGIFIE